MFILPRLEPHYHWLLVALPDYPSITPLLLGFICLKRPRILTEFPLEITQFEPIIVELPLLNHTKYLTLAESQDFTRFAILMHKVERNHCNFMVQQIRNQDLILTRLQYHDLLLINHRHFTHPLRKPPTIHNLPLLIQMQKHILPNLITPQHTESTILSRQDLVHLQHTLLHFYIELFDLQFVL